MLNEDSPFHNVHVNMLLEEIKRLEEHINLLAVSHSDIAEIKNLLKLMYLEMKNK